MIYALQNITYNKSIELKFQLITILYNIEEYICSYGYCLDEPTFGKLICYAMIFVLFVDDSF